MSRSWARQRRGATGGRRRAFVRARRGLKRVPLATYNWRKPLGEKARGNVLA
jgi:hypothetical protein